MKRFINNLFIIALILLVSNQVMCEELQLSQKLDLQFRFDDRSDRDHRNQYRMRYYPSLSLTPDASWSLNSFIVTGQSFSSSHNTLGSDSNDYLYARRLFVRYAHDNGKVELGVIPTYKGRVSSSGLSKDGWIKGVRSVFSLKNSSEIEFVVGQLDNTLANKAIGSFHTPNYIELEYSAKMGQTHSYEFSLERMTNSNFLRAEYRWQFTRSNTVFFETIQTLSETNAKYVVGISGEGHIQDYPVSYFSHYSYVSEGFGPRAELTEDFLGTGHGISAEMSGAITLFDNTYWFVRADVVNSVSRLLSGVKVSFAQ